VGRQRNNLKYVVVGHFSGESGFPSVGAMRRTVTRSRPPLKMHPAADAPQEEHKCPKWPPSSCHTSDREQIQAHCRKKQRSMRSSSSVA